MNPQFSIVWQSKPAESHEPCIATCGRDAVVDAVIDGPGITVYMRCCGEPECREVVKSRARVWIRDFEDEASGRRKPR